MSPSGRIALGLFGLGWLACWAVLFLDAGATLPDAPADLGGFLFGEVVVGAFVLALLRLARGRPAIGPGNAPAFRRPGAETTGLLLWLAAVVAVGALIGAPTHVASLGLTESTLAVWDEQTPGSLLLWAGYYFMLAALIPALYFLRVRGYRPRDLLMGFPRPRRWVPFALITGTLGILGFAGPEYWTTPLTAHLAALLIFTLGTLLPVMILTQSLLAPRLAVLGGSWIVGAVLVGLVYAAYHATEFYLSWASPSEGIVSLAWLGQFAYFGLLKGITTLRTGNAWLHIFVTHTPHLAEAPAVARVLGIR
jgi:hypothetical protein